MHLKLCWLCGTLVFRGSGFEVIISVTLRSKDSYVEAFGTKDHTIQGLWAVLSLRVKLK